MKIDTNHEKVLIVEMNNLITFEHWLKKQKHFQQSLRLMSLYEFTFAETHLYCCTTVFLVE